MTSRDVLLLERWTSGRDAEAFAELISHYAAFVYATSRRILGNESDAQDIAQECFLRLAKSPPTEHSSLGGWLHKVATNLSLSALRGDSARRRREDSFGKERTDGAEVEWDDIQQFVDEAIEELPEDIRKAIVEHFLQGRTHESIAQEAGLSRQAIHYRIKRGVEKIRVSLAGRGIPVGAAALSTMLGVKVVEAAPAALVTSLGKLAVSGVIPRDAGKVSAGGGLTTGTGTVVGAKSLVALAGLAILVVGGIIAFIPSKGQVPADAPPLSVAVGGADEETLAQPAPIQTPPEALTLERVAAVTLEEEPASTATAATVQPEEEPQVVAPVWSGRVIDVTRNLPVAGVYVTVRLTTSEVLNVTTVTGGNDLRGRSNWTVAPVGVLHTEDAVVSREAFGRKTVESLTNMINRAPLETEEQLRDALFSALVTTDPESENTTRYVTNSDGYFEMTDLQPGDYIATVDTGPFVSIGEVRIKADIRSVLHQGSVELGSGFPVLPGQDPGEIRVEVVPAGTVSGRVFDVVTRQGRGNVLIQAKRSTSTPYIRILEGEIRTDAQGYFSIPALRVGSYVLVREEIEGYIGEKAVTQEFSYEPAQLPEDVDFLLSAGGLLTGTVYIEDEPMVNGYFDLSFVQPEEDIADNASWERPLVDYSIPTDENGEYLVSGIRTVEGALIGTLLMQSGQTRKSLHSVTDVYENEINVVDLKFIWGSAAVEGFVRREDGRPVKNATVRWNPRRHSDRSRNGVSHVQTDAEGHYRMEGIDAGDQVLRVYYLSLNCVVVPVTLAESETLTLDVVYPTQGVSYRVLNIPETSASVSVVVLPEGYPIDFQRSWLESTADSWQNHVAWSRKLGPRVPGLLLGLEPGNYRIVASATPSPGDLVPYLDEDQLAEHLELTFLIITEIEVGEDPSKTKLILDFEKAPTAVDIMNGVDP